MWTKGEISQHICFWGSKLTIWRIKGAWPKLLSYGLYVNIASEKCPKHHIWHLDLIINNQNYQYFCGKYPVVGTSAWRNEPLMLISALLSPTWSAVEFQCSYSTGCSLQGQLYLPSCTGVANQTYWWGENNLPIRK